ncbi:alpha-N-acetylneuraminide alpha-2,8-sialyltransferase-like isoform X1 [Erpetoichthys calabaricus]|uniref:alpha-N-acetylneuraminide alpha-2,8-sialyltransferase-like isoform X1 n=1 Tax=Erpetoichthys calabaricus TaxID=27687 RepID=UPI002234B066|nr:alpha-N-acetylneuraminide alpha-2,8-sialyltransferase-like isoform X1 [Erpetoichthys calabaricus]
MFCFTMTKKKLLLLLFLTSLGLLLCIFHTTTEIKRSQLMIKSSKHEEPVVLSNEMKIACHNLWKKILSWNSLNKISPKDLIREVQLMKVCPWIQHLKNHNNYSLELQSCCNASHNLVLTKGNIKVGEKITFEMETKKTRVVDEALYEMLPEGPLWSKTLGHCAVIGNGGILRNSSCGEQIDQADIVIRLNLPPLNYTTDVGTKTDLVTANPSILFKYDSLSYARKPFIQKMKAYGHAEVLMPAFAYAFCMEPSFRVYFTLQDFNLQHVSFFHPGYLSKLHKYWRNKRLTVTRLSSGMMLVSVALELCSKVSLYGFWPFPYDLSGQPLIHHYYDNQPATPGMHAMPLEFLNLLQMHRKGILKVNIGKCL